MFKRKWHWALAAFVVFCLGSFIVFTPKPGVEPLKVYKTVTPRPKPSPTETKIERTEPAQHRHDHPHGPALHSHTAETPKSADGYDWRDDDDDAFVSTFPKRDPWKQTYPEREPTDETDENYPPRDWYKTEDPALYIEYLQAQLIKQFGDIPEVQTFVAFRERMQLGIPIKDADEYLSFLKAQYTLWPMEETRETLETLEKQMAEGANIVFVPMETP